MYYVELEGVVTADGVRADAPNSADGKMHESESAAYAAIANHHGIEVFGTRATYVGRGILTVILRASGCTWVYAIINTAWKDGAK